MAFGTRRGAGWRALDEVSFDIAAGEVLGMVGESGAGKSLTGAALIGLLPPSSELVQGEITLDGQRVDRHDAAAWRRLRGRSIGAIFQDPMTALDPLFTVGQQLIETLRTHHALTASQARARAIEWLQRTGMADAAQRIDLYPHQLSGGLRQRVVIALALAPEPRLLIADEPTTALDVSVQAQVMGLLKRLCREQGTAMLLITHDMGVVAQTCDRVAVMYAGRVVETGAVDAVLARPQHPYTAGLMAAIPRLDAPVGALKQIDGSMPRGDALPAGCAFRPRCPHAFEHCAIERPMLRAAGASDAACWLHAPSEARP